MVDGERFNNGERLPVVVEQIADPNVAGVLKKVVFALGYIAFLATVSVVATWLTPGGPF